MRAIALLLLLALAACQADGEEMNPRASGPYIGGGAGPNARIGGSLGQYYSITR